MKISKRISGKKEQDMSSEFLESFEREYDDDSVYSSNNEDSRHNGLQNHQDDEAARQRKSLRANKESKAVFWLRIIIFFSLFCAAAVVSFGVYYVSQAEEQDDFEAAFEIHATKVIESFKAGFDRKIGSIGGMANAITNYAVSDADAEFPFITVPNFEVLGSDVRVQADALAVVWAPLVVEEKRPEWEEFALSNHGQMDAAVEKDANYLKEEDAFYAAIEAEGRTSGTETTDNSDSQKRALQGGHPNMLQDGSNYHLRIWDIPRNHNASVENSGPYLPLWQRSPVPPGSQVLINMNWGTTLGMANIYRYVLEGIDNPKVVINQAAVPVALGREQIKQMVSHSQFRFETGNEYLDDPTSFLFYPVFDSFDKTGRSLTGYVVAQLYWRLFFTDILPVTAKGIIAVIENSYNQTLSYKIDGPQVTFLGEGDFHDPSYDGMGVSDDITDYVNSRSSPETRAFRTVPLHDTIGVHRLYVYPTTETEEEYKSQDPLIYTLVVAAVFLMTVTVFVFFNWSVERRQNVVMTQAVKAGTLVTSLFPKQVQERLYNDAENKAQDEMTGSAQWKRRRAVDQSSVSFDPLDHDIGGKSPNRSGGQIADLYPETTIMFADLAGFTKWSSSRSPSDVFDLLETLYNCFDRVALKRKVFKVETIGDCYLAVCGLPDPNPNHAVVMSKFANEILNRMDLIVRKVSERFGGCDTVDLQLRVGLHSGAAVAGVLRGSKGRFQIFGDTVNTAARMESTGKPGRIQISQETADQLAIKGKRSWLVPREEAVVAKGKGELSTFWLRIRADGSATTSVFEGTASLTSGGDGGSGIFRNPFLNTLDENDEDDESAGSIIFKDEPLHGGAFDETIWV